jgi:hypothetical protein
MSIIAVAWGEKIETENSVLYTLQATVRGKREMNRLNKEVLEWSSAGKGYDPTTEKTIVLLQRKFENKKSWIKFAKSLSFPVEELSPRTGKGKIINGKKKTKRSQYERVT